MSETLTWDCQSRFVTYTQVKKGAYKINAKIINVGLTEHLKSAEKRNGH